MFLHFTYRLSTPVGRSTSFRLSGLQIRIRNANREAIAGSPTGVLCRVSRVLAQRHAGVGFVR